MSVFHSLAASILASLTSPRSSPIRREYSPRRLANRGAAGAFWARGERRGGEYGGRGLLDWVGGGVPREEPDGRLDDVVSSFLRMRLTTSYSGRKGQLAVVVAVAVVVVVVVVVVKPRMKEVRGLKIQKWNQIDSAN